MFRSSGLQIAIGIGLLSLMPLADSPWVFILDLVVGTFNIWIGVSKIQNAIEGEL